MKFRALAVAEPYVSVLLCLPGMVVASATDVHGHWAQEQIEKWLTDGLIKGYPDGQFKPDQEITRAEFVALVNVPLKNKLKKPQAAFPM